jgi:hypothetical protein
MKSFSWMAKAIWNKKLSTLKVNTFLFKWAFRDRRVARVRLVQLALREFPAPPGQLAHKPPLVRLALRAPLGQLVLLDQPASLVHMDLLALLAHRVRLVFRDQLGLPVYKASLVQLALRVQLVLPALLV